MRRVSIFIAFGLLIEAAFFALVQVEGRSLRPRVGAVLAVLATAWMLASALKLQTAIPSKLLLQALLVSTAVRVLGWLSLGIGMPLASPVAYLAGVPFAIVLWGAFAAAQVYGGVWVARRFGSS